MLLYIHTYLLMYLLNMCLTKLEIRWGSWLPNHSGKMFNRLYDPTLPLEWLVLKNMLVLIGLRIVRQLVETHIVWHIVWYILIYWLPIYFTKYVFDQAGEEGDDYTDLPSVRMRVNLELRIWKTLLKIV